MTKAHNELPWKVGGHPGTDAGTRWRQILAAGEFGEMYVGEAIDTDAEFIVRACNAYDDLVQIAQAVSDRRVDEIVILQARKLLIELAKSTPYNAAQIAWQLERTAKGDGFYGNALRVAKDIPGVSDGERALLDRYATGAQSGTDHIALQDLALRIAKAGAA